MGIKTGLEQRVKRHKSLELAPGWNNQKGKVIHLCRNSSRELSTGFSFVM